MDEIFSSRIARILSGSGVAGNSHIEHRGSIPHALIIAVEIFFSFLASVVGLREVTEATIPVLDVRLICS